MNSQKPQEQNLVKVKLGGQTYHVHISEQERQARTDAKNRASTLHKETIRRKRNHEQKKLSHDQKEEQHRQKVLAARRAQLSLQTQRYLRATSRRPAPPIHPRSKVTSPRPYSAFNPAGQYSSDQYPSGTVSAREESGEIDSVLNKINRRADVLQNQNRGYLQPINRVQSARPHHRDIIQNRPATAAIISKISNDDIKNVTNLNQQNMRLATNKFGHELFDMMQGGDTNVYSVRKQWSKDDKNNKNEGARNESHNKNEGYDKNGSGDSVDNDTFRKDAPVFPEKLHKIKKTTDEVFDIKPKFAESKLIQPVLNEPIAQPTIVVARIQELRRDIQEINTRDRHIPSPLENIPDNPSYLPRPPSKSEVKIQQISSQNLASPNRFSQNRSSQRTVSYNEEAQPSNSPPKYESVFQVNQPESDATRVNESVASASGSETSSVCIRDIEDYDGNSDSSSTLIDQLKRKNKAQGPPGILRRTKSAFERNNKNIVFDSIDLAKSRTKSAGVRQKRVGWKQIEYQDFSTGETTVRPFPQDIEDLRAKSASARQNNSSGGNKFTIQANITNKPSILNYKKQSSKQKVIQDAQMTGYAQQHIARKQFDRKQKKVSGSTRPRQVKPKQSISRPKSANDYLEARRTPTDTEITQLWQTVKHVIDENEKHSSPHDTKNDTTQIRQLPQSYYLPRPPTVNNSAFIYSPGFRGQAPPTKLNRPKVPNPSSLSMEEKRLVHSLDRLNSRLNEIELNVRK